MFGLTDPKKSHGEAGDQGGRGLQKWQSEEYGDREAVNWVQ